MKKLTTVLLLAFVALSCSKPDPVPAHVDFFNFLKTQCGKSYEGVATFTNSDNDPFSGKTLTMTFSECSENQLLIPFDVGEDKSRTWIMTLSDEGLLFKHKHLLADGSLDSITNYGGWADTTGTMLVQHFPADEFTAQLIPAAETNVWTWEFSEDKKSFSYILKRHGALRFSAKFDLTKPINK